MCEFPVSIILERGPVSALTLISGGSDRTTLGAQERHTARILILHIHLRQSLSEAPPMALQNPSVKVLHSLAILGLCGWALTKPALYFSPSDVRDLQTGNL